MGHISPNQSLQQTAGRLLCLLSVISSPAAAEFYVRRKIRITCTHFMNKNKEHAKQLRHIADEIDPPVHHVREIPEPETSEVAQEAHEAALISFQTKRKGKHILSLNAHPDKKH
jgi:adenylyl- and sulfurtransferase ThiI